MRRKKRSLPTVPLETIDLGHGMVAVTDPRFTNPQPPATVFSVARDCGWKLAFLWLAVQVLNRMGE
ncbi:MAG: hypothetical protein ACYCOR_10670 [Acidobacteriaceae bacterium]